ncbi:MAG: bifunctional diguanylate cyclase/phosphodiesterase [Gammaproteobacteria bacterium]|nr:bifunctional diguanylate cyclase/phosphodiesterase [Gammaproteobacteria bacterium]
MTEATENRKESNRPTQDAHNAADNPARTDKPSKSRYSWPELAGLMLIAGIAIFVIVSIEKIAVDLSHFGQNSNAQNTIQLERLQLRLESVRKILQLGMINTEENTLTVAHHEILSIQQQLNELLPEPSRDAQHADIAGTLASLREQAAKELGQIESLLRTGGGGFTTDSAPVLRLILQKIDKLLDKTQAAVRSTALIQSANVQAQNRLLNDFSEYSSLFLTIFGLFAAGLLGLALYQRQLFSSQLNANQMVDLQTRKLHDTIEGFSSACALFDEHQHLQSCNSEFLKLLPEPVRSGNSSLTVDKVLQILQNGEEPAATGSDQTAASPVSRPQAGENLELVDYQGRNLLISERPTRDGGLMCIYRDVSYIHHTESRLKYLDNHDKLTQLPNRNRFLEDLGVAIARAGKQSEIAVVMFDIHNFREINDTYGHTMGDRVLQMIAGTIHGGFAPSEYAARIGGDEFASIITDVSDHTALEEQATAILAALRNGFTLDNTDIPIQVSVGISYYPSHGKTVTGLINNADTASVHARKNALIRPGIYNNRLKHRTERRRLIERHMHHAIELDELRVQYQPQIDVRSGMTTGMEALLRWNNSKLGEISPAEFIPLAEDNGLIMELGEWVLKQSISDYQQLARYGMSPGVLSINLSRRQFNSSNIASTIETTLAKAGITPRQLTLEITETAIMDDTNRTAQILNELKEMGVGLSIDDFGVGYSSFAALREFPIDEVKIDRLFVADVVNDTSSQEIIRAIIDVAHALKAEVVAEGIENRKQFEMVKYLGCHRAQGFFLCEPMEATTFPDVCLGGKSIPAS